LKIWGEFGSRNFQAVTLAHVARPLDGPAVVALLAKDIDGRRRFTQEPIATETMRGRLRLSRTDDKLCFLVAHEDEEAFREVYDARVGYDDMVALRISAHPGGSSSGLEITLRDLRIRADGLPVSSGSEDLGTAVLIWTIVIVLGGASGFSLWRYRTRPDDSARKSNAKQPAGDLHVEIEMNNDFC
jgi:hypothetical protein